jgi:hypothetical protein
MGSGGIAPPFLISALDGGEWSVLLPGRFASGEIVPGYPLDKRLGGPTDPVWTLWRREKSWPAGNRTRAVQRILAFSWREWVKVRKSSGQPVPPRRDSNLTPPKCESKAVTVTLTSKQASKQASSSLLLAFSSMVILGVEPHRDPWPYFCSIFNPYAIRQWASSSVRGGVGLFNAVIYFIRW